jgi:hypothetical protein
MNKICLACILGVVIQFSGAFKVLADWPDSPLPLNLTTSSQDTEYLRDIMKGAFRSIEYFRNPKTGITTDFPEDPDSQELRKTEDIFLTFASIAIAGKTGLLPENEAVQEVDKILTSIEKFRRNNGFFWVTYKPADCTTVSESDPIRSMYNLSDLGWCYCSLAMVGEAYPQFKKRTEKILKEVEWSRLYSVGNINCFLRFHDDGTMTAMEAPLHDITLDSRPAVFMAIGSGQIPAEAWNRYKKNFVDRPRYGLTYFKPAELMGYGEQPMAMGYFLDERGSIFGKMNANMGWGQICYAADMEFPAWGWSSCQDLDGYLGWGGHKTRSWSRINTHACAAQVYFYPNQVVKNFRAMEKLGIRKDLALPSGEKKDFGFLDSIDVDSHTVPPVILSLDQNIVFLSLANYLYGGIIWKYFMKNGMVRHALAVIDDYGKPDIGILSEYQKRDLAGPGGFIPEKKSERPRELIADDFSGELNSWGGMRTPVNSVLNVRKNEAEIGFKYMNESISSLSEGLKGRDLTDFNALKLVICGNESGRIMVNMHLGGEGGYIPVNIGNDWSEIIIPFRSFLMGKGDNPINFGDPSQVNLWSAMWHDRSRAQDISLGPLSVEKIRIKKLSFLSLSNDEIHNAVLNLNRIPGFGTAGLFDNMNDKLYWEFIDDGQGTGISAQVREGRKHRSLKVSFSIPEKGGWVDMARDADLDLAAGDEISFYMKCEGGPANLEVKIKDASGATFRKVLNDAVNDSDWHEIRLKVSDLEYAWGGIKRSFPIKAMKIEFAFTSYAAGKSVHGIAQIEDLKVTGRK